MLSLTSPRHISTLPTRDVAPCLKCAHSRHSRKRGERLELAQLSDQHQAEIKELIDAQPRLMDCAGREPTVDVHSAVVAAWGRPAGTRLPRRQLDRIRPRWIDRDPAHRKRDRQGSGTKQRHDPEPARAEGAVEWTGQQCHDGGHRTDGDAAIDPLSCRGKGRWDNHRKHLHAGQMQ
jgi:hypothetical protein